jgi:hypothetical protein
LRTPLSPNLSILAAVASLIRPLLAECVFVGGHMAELLVTERGAVRPRATDDVDVIVPVTTRSEYFRLGERLQHLGLRNDMSEGAPLCRWRTPDNLALDVMPADAAILNFTNRWYLTGIETAVEYQLRKDLIIRGATAPLFLAMKWEAFNDRGHRDVFGSHDLEDIITVVAGRRSLPSEVAGAPPEVRAWLAEEAERFLADPNALSSIAGALPDAVHIPGLVDEVTGRFETLAGLHT